MPYLTNQIITAELRLHQKTFLSFLKPLLRLRHDGVRVETVQVPTVQKAQYLVRDEHYSLANGITGFPRDPQLLKPKP